MPTVAQRPFKRSAFLALGVLLAALVGGVGAVSSLRKIESFQPTGFAAVRDAGSWVVTEVEADDAGLLAGDRILLINGREVAAVGDLDRALRAQGESRLEVLRGDGLVSVDYRLPPLRPDFPYLILALIGVGYLLIGFYTVWRDSKKEAAIFYLWCLVSATFYIVTYTTLADRTGRALFVIDQVARVLLPALTLHLFLVFPRPREGENKWHRLVPFAYLPAVFLIAAQADAMLLQGRFLWGGNVAGAIAILDQLEMAHLVAFSLIAAGLLAWRLYRRQEAESQRQAIWIAVGMVGGYLPFLALYVAPRLVGQTAGPWQTSLAVLPLALVPLTFAYAILRYKLWDLGSLVRGGVSLVLTVLVGALGFALLNVGLNRTVPEDLQAARTAASFLSGLMIAGLMIPARRRIDASLERLQYRDAFERRRALGDLGKQLLRERNLATLCGDLLDRLAETFAIEHVALYLRSNNELVRVDGEHETPERLTMEPFGASFWNSEVHALSGVEFPTDAASASRDLFATGLRYVFPLRVRDSRVGLLALGYKHGDLPLSSEDLDLVQGLLTQASLAIENAQLLTQVNEQLSEVTRLQDYTREIIESSPAGIAVIDGRERIESANAGFAALVGQAAEALVGQPIGSLLSVSELPRPGEGAREIVLGTGEDEQHLQVSAAVISDGNRDRVILVLQDVSERVSMENALREKERLASLGMLAAGVAHEVNTPLTGISSYAQMLLDDTATDDPRRPLIEKVERQTFRAARIVNNLLEFSRKRPREFRRFDLQTTLYECVELLEERIAEQGVEVRISTSDAFVEGNEGELHQVFTNLLVNALDALRETADGVIEIHSSEESDAVAIRISDNGPGIAQEDLEQIFQPFYSTKLASGGTGLGLSISYNIVRRHGGELSATSQLGDGAEFIVRLPSAEAPSESSPEDLNPNARGE